MKRLLSCMAVLALLVGSASAELDLEARKELQNIRDGKNDGKAIKNLLVTGSVNIPAGSLEVADLPTQATVTGRVITAVSYNGSNSIVFTTRPVVFVNGVATMGSPSVTTNAVP